MDTPKQRTIETRCPEDRCDMSRQGSQPGFLFFLCCSGECAPACQLAGPCSSDIFRPKDRNLECASEQWIQGWQDCVRMLHGAGCPHSRGCPNFRWKHTALPMVPEFDIDQRPKSGNVGPPTFCWRQPKQAAGCAGPGHPSRDANGGGRALSLTWRPRARALCFDGSVLSVSWVRLRALPLSTAVRGTRPRPASVWAVLVFAPPSARFKLGAAVPLDCCEMVWVPQEAALVKTSAIRTDMGFATSRLRL